MNIPIIKITLEQMRHEMTHAFAGHQLQLSEEFDKAMKAALDPAAVQRLMETEVKTQLQEAVHNAVRGYFNYGAGAELVREQVHQSLNLLKQSEAPALNFKYEHEFSVHFSLRSNIETAAQALEQVPLIVVEALKRRALYLSAHPEEVREACTDVATYDLSTPPKPEA